MDLQPTPALEKWPAITRVKYCAVWTTVLAVILHGYERTGLSRKQCLEKLSRPLSMIYHFFFVHHKARVPSHAFINSMRQTIIGIISIVVI
jgi:hypothetical protein